MTLSLNNYNSKKTFKAIFYFSLPPMISMLIQSLYNIVDSIYVGQIGNDAITAITYAMPLQNIILAFAVGTGVGVSSYLSRKLGEKDYTTIQKTIIQGFYLAIFTAIIFVLLGYLFIPSFFKMFTTDDHILQMCYDYTYIVVYFGVFQLVHIMIEKILQANGKMVFAMIMQGVGAIINIILDPIFIFNLGMGVKGAAIATIIGQGVAMLVSLVFLFITKFEFKISFKYLKPDFKIIKEIYRVGISSISMITLTSLLVIFLNSLLSQYGNDAVNVYGLYFKLQTFVFMPVSGLTQGIMPILAYNYGGKNNNNIKLVLRNSIFISLIIMAIGTVLFLSIPELLLAMFSASDKTIEIGSFALRILALSFIPAAIAVVVPTLFQAMGKGFDSLIVFLLRQFIIVLPLAYLFSYLFGLNGIWFVFLIAEVISSTVALLLYFRLKKKDEVLMGAVL